MVVYTKRVRRSRPKKVAKRRTVVSHGRGTGNVVRQLSLVKFGHGIPLKAMVTHRYVENFTMTSTTGADALYRFRCNGMFDPNQTSTGHQPMYFDQLAALYNHYIVIGSKIRYKIVQTTSSQVPGVITTFLSDDTNNTETSPFINAEYSKAKTTILPPASRSVTYLTSKFSARKVFGKGVMANNDLAALTAADPAEEQYFVLNYRSIDGTSTSSIYVEAVIDYIAIWFEQKQLGQS